MDYDNTNYQIIQTVEKIIEFYNGKDILPISEIGANIKITSSISPIWKRTHITFSEFLKKFPKIFDLQNENVRLLEREIDEKYIIEAWNVIETDLEKFEKKWNKKLQPLVLPETNILVTQQSDICDEWIE